MNNLNSIIYEGNVCAPAEVMAEGVVLFTVESFRYTKRKDKRIEERTLISVEVDPNESNPARRSLADRCLEWCIKGRGVRVIGRLSGDIHGHKIAAEHIEFRRGIPEDKKDDRD